MSNAALKQQDYFAPRPLIEDVEALSDPALSANDDREDVNRISLNIIIKYLTNYSGVLTKNIHDIRAQVKDVIRIANAAEADPKGYDAKRYREMNCGQSGSDYYPLMCLADIRTTAAIFKEIAFNDCFKKEDHFIGLDLGSGTGITTLAMAIAAKRKGIQDIICIGVEKNSLARYKSSKYLKRILGDQVEMICGDIATSDLYDQISGKSELLKRVGWDKTKPIHYWVSETIAASTPPVKGDRYSDDWDDQEVTSNDWTPRQQVNVDPFYYAYWIAKRQLGWLPNRSLGKFGHDVQKGRTAMFPDPISGLYNPKFEKSTLKLRTGLNPNQPLLLEHIGWEFNEYEDLKTGCHRWEPGNGQLPLI